MSDWDFERLSQQLELIESGCRPKGGVADYSSGVPSLSAEQIREDGSFVFETLRYVPHGFYANAKRGRIRRGDILVVKDGATTGKTAFVGDDFPFEEAMVNEHTFILRTKPTLLPKFAFLCLQSEMASECFSAARSHGIIGGLTQSFPDEIEIPVPPLADQRRLVGRIEALTRRLELARQTRQAALAQAETFFSAVMHATLEENAECETPLAKLCKMKTGKTPPTSKPEYFDGDIPFVCPSDLGERLRITSAERQVCVSAVADKKANLFQRGTVLLCGIGATVGKVGLAARDLCTNQQITGLIFNSKILPDYAAWFLTSQRHVIQTAAAGGGMPIINQNGMGELILRYPSSRDQQQRIVDRLDSLRAKLDELRHLQKETEAALARFTPALLARAFRGEL